MSTKLALAAAALVVALTAPALAADAARRNAGHHARVTRTGDLPARFDRAAHAEVAPDAGFVGWPTDYLNSRFGDRQAQGTGN
jgi:hypothetical protein